MSLNRRFQLVLALVLTGLVMLLAGLAWDASIHASAAHEDTPHEEELFSTENPGHVMLGAGLALIVSGAALGLLFSQSRLKALAPASLGAVALVSLASGVLAYGLSVSTAGHTHSHSQAAAQPSEEEIRAQLRASGLSEQDITLVETSRHEDHQGASLPMSAADVAKLGSELAEAMQVAQRYQDIDAALAENYLQITQDLPLIGAHFIRLDYANDGVFDIEKPEMLIYHFENGAWKLYGLSYLTGVLGYEGQPPPEGFTGPYDSWHWHENWCFTLTGARSSDAEHCRPPLEFFAARTGYMVHVWVVDNPLGVFSHSHPGLTGSSEYMPAADLVRAFLSTSRN